MAFVAFGRDIFEKKVPTFIFGKTPQKDAQYIFNKNLTFVFSIYNGERTIPIKELDRLFKVIAWSQDVDPARSADGNTFIKTAYN